MKTIIRIHRGADFSENNLGTFSLETEIVIPTSGILGAYRFKGSINEAQNIGGGPWATAISNGSPEFLSTYVHLPEDTFLGLSGQPMTPTGTVAVVFRQPASLTDDGRNMFLCGTMGGSGNLGLFRSNSTGRYGFFVGGAAFSATEPDGGDRWEMLFATFDQATGAVRIIRPRTETVTSSDAPVWPNPTQSVRLLGYNDIPLNVGHSVDGAYTAVWDRVLTDQEISGVYASAKESLAFSGIDI